MPTAEMGLDRLRHWHEEYIATDSNGTWGDHQSVGAVNSDHLDTTEVEEKIQLAALQTVVSRGFCGKCSHLLKNWPTPGERSWETMVGGPRTSIEMEAGARHDCRFCSFVLTLLDHTGFLTIFRKIEKRLELLNLDATMSFSVIKSFFDETLSIRVDLPGGLTMPSKKHCFPELFIESHMTLPSAYREKEPDRWDTAANWIHACRQSHNSCRHVVSGPRPTRLVSISNNTVRLVLTENWAKTPSYATLSYSWGRDEFLKLTANTMSLFLDIIPFEELPKTFQDAIQIARRLGLEYIWIDALCIVQNTQDSADWQRESGRMRYIYGGSHLNIAMTTTRSAHEACPTPNPGHRGGFVARVETDDMCQIRTFHALGAFGAATTGSPLARRAWTMQERLLAPRTIYFGPDDLFWECRCTIASEFIPSGFEGLQGHLVRPSDKAWVWDDIVRTYSRGNLTNSSDKLPALSGIARRQHEITGDEYLAGMWRAQLFRQLAWRAMGGNIRPKWRAPTWSWTSIDGSVAYLYGSEYAYSERHDYCRVLHASTVLASSDPFGAVSDAELQLSCSGMIRGSYDRFSVSRPSVSISLAAGSYALPVFLDSPESDAHDTSDEVYLLPLFRGGYRWPQPGKRENSINSERTDYDEDAESAVEDRLVCGLLLRKQDLYKRGLQRMGFFEYHSNMEMSTVPGINPYYAFLHTFEECGSSTAESECTEILPGTEHSGRPYVISIA